VRKHFARNPYIVANVMDVWECDLLDVQAYAKYNDNHRHILSVIDLFSKFLHMIPVKTNSGPSVASAFRSMCDDPKYSSKRPVWVRTHKGKELEINIFRTRYGTTRTFSFRFVETPT